MLDSNDIDSQRELLNVHRRTLAHFQKQAAQYGGEVLAPPQVLNGLGETREKIRQIKAFLRANGVQVADHPFEEPLSLQPSAQGIETEASGTSQSSIDGIGTIDEEHSRALHLAIDYSHVPNPFGKVGRIDEPKDFFGRDALLRQLFEELSKGCNLSLVGESQIGKSSILSMVCKLGPEHLNLPNDAFIYLDMELIHDERDFFEALCDSLNISVCRGFKLARALRGRRYILCLDEIEKMAKDRFTGDEREELRGLADGDHAPFRLIISSRVPLDQLFPDSPGKTSPLANICPQVDVLPFTPDIAQAFIYDRLKSTGVMFKPTEIVNLVARSNGYPARLQQAAAILFNQYRSKI